MTVLDTPWLIKGSLKGEGLRGVNLDNTHVGGLIGIITC